MNNYYHEYTADDALHYAYAIIPSPVRELIPNLPKNAAVVWYNSNSIDGSVPADLWKSIDGAKRVLLEAKKMNDAFREDDN